MAAPRGPPTPLLWPCAPAARLARCPAAGTRLLAPLGAGTVQTGTGSGAPEAGPSSTGGRQGPLSPRAGPRSRRLSGAGPRLAVL